ncbi:hypothetical protein EalM132_00041 [Exiguobacterium phage vB_EalM-132]|nr:hypothetical protein EalM132_00041 [Exiguobacterium phage vB_EalM-132]
MDTYEKVECRLCGYKSSHLSSHIMGNHKMSCAKYKEQHPDAPMMSKQRRNQLSKNNPARTQKFRKEQSKRMSGKNNPNYKEGE